MLLLEMLPHPQVLGDEVPPALLLQLLGGGECVAPQPDDLHGGLGVEAGVGLPVDRALVDLLGLAGAVALDLGLVDPVQVLQETQINSNA